MDNSGMERLLGFMSKLIAVIKNWTKFISNAFSNAYFSQNAIKLCSREQSFVVIRVLPLNKNWLFFPRFPEEK